MNDTRYLVLIEDTEEESPVGDVVVMADSQSGAAEKATAQLSDPSSERVGLVIDADRVVGFAFSMVRWAGCRNEDELDRFLCAVQNSSIREAAETIGASIRCPIE